jgi:hypothetical protein
MFQRLRETLSLILIGLLPFHAFLVTVGTRVLRGPDQAPWGLLAAWKEGVLALILLIALAEIIRNARASLLRPDRIDAIILTLVALGLLVSARLFPADLKAVVYGFRYDFVPLLAFMVLRRTEWSDAFRRRCMFVLTGAGVLAAAYGVISFLLPASFFHALGYSDQHSLYLPNHPIAAFQQISGSALRRIQSVMSGPNQLGLWLLLPWSFVLVTFLGVGEHVPPRLKPRLVPVLVLLALAIFLTFSRSAWVALFLLSLVGLRRFLPGGAFRSLLMGLGGLCVLGAVTVSLWDPAVFFRLSSNRGHLERPLQALHMMQSFPLGLGLGSAGPATNHLREACVFLLPGDDPSWAKSSPNLCVFVGKAQVQPAGRACNCPFLPENWYLQIGVETGVLGLLLYLWLTGALLRAASMGSRLAQTYQKRRHALAVYLAFLGIAVAALFLHAWEDSAVAYTVFILLASLPRSAPGLVGTDTDSPR